MVVVIVVVIAVAIAIIVHILLIIETSLVLGHYHLTLFSASSL